MVDRSGYGKLSAVSAHPVERRDERFEDCEARTEAGTDADMDTHRTRRNAKWFLTGLLSTGAVLMLVLYGTGNINAPKANLQRAIRYDVTMKGKENADALPSCSWATDAQWHPLTSADERAIPAVNNSFKLASAKRKDCHPALGELDWEPANFVRDVASDFHVEMFQKFTGDCSGETYKLDFSITNVQDFEIQVQKDRLTDVWTLLTTNPDVCKMNVETSSAPRIVDVNAPDVKKAAEFAIGELSYRSTSSDCLDSKEEVHLMAILTATTTIMAGVKYKIIAAIKYDGVMYPSATLEVLSRCGDSISNCVLQLEVPEGTGDWCDPDNFKKIFADTTKESRRLGVTEQDHGEAYAAQRRTLYPRRLGDDSKDPMFERQITSGDVEESFDPTDEDCYKKVAVYQEGECASCYAQAFAQMMGIRACLAKGRRLKALARQLGDSTSTSLKSNSPARQLGDCEDDDTWHAFGEKDIDCAFFAEHGCDKWSDFGQFTHCKASCEVCDNAKKPSTDFTDANFKFMPSVNDIVACSKGPRGEARGCSGGNMWEMWNNYMATSDRSLYVMSEKCKPYTLKCFFGEEVVNSLRTDDMCDGFDDYGDWEKPCSCIPAEDKPKEIPECPSEKPSPACDFKVPSAAFVALGVAGGLSLDDAVLNFQRHITEYGPVFITILMTTKFLEWDWDKEPTYTGGGSQLGGHAMILAGWGKDGAVPYWIARNSWGTTWGNKGYCQFLRGQNLDGIENHAGATMPEDDYDDFSAPTCRITSWRREWSYEGKMLYDYNLFLKFRCNEKATVKAFYSVIVHDRQNLKKGVSGMDETFDVGEKEEVEAPVVSMTLLNFGVESGDMWIRITATDEAGNEKVTTNILSIPKVAGMDGIQTV
jgi:hypothetical protein